MIPKVLLRSREFRKELVKVGKLDLLVNIGFWRESATPPWFDPESPSRADMESEVGRSPTSLPSDEFEAAGDTFTSSLVDCFASFVFGVMLSIFISWLSHAAIFSASISESSGFLVSTASDSRNMFTFRYDGPPFVSIATDEFDGDLKISSSSSVFASRSSSSFVLSSPISSLNPALIKRFLKRSSDDVARGLGRNISALSPPKELESLKRPGSVVSVVRNESYREYDEFD
jgi:hypothetical protein